MGIVFKKIKEVGEDIGETVIHTVTHTAHLTIDGVEQAISVVTDETGKAVHDVVVAGKVVVKAGELIH
jgi:hypothetical protein